MPKGNGASPGQVLEQCRADHDKLKQLIRPVRGFNEARDQIEALRARWPKAFPLQAHEVRPLETATLDIIVNEMGWTRPYARAVLAVWKKRTAYCRAILAYPTRFR